MLTIRGRREEESKEDKHGMQRHERHSGSFVRSVTLPPYIDMELVIGAPEMLVSERMVLEPVPQVDCRRKKSY